MFKISTPLLAFVGLLSCQATSAQEQQPEISIPKRIHVAYKYHVMADDSEEAKKFPQYGHSVQLGYTFWPDELGFFTFVIDYTHMRQYRHPQVSSAGIDISTHPGKIIASIWRKPYTPRLDKWLVTAGSYKTLDKYQVNYISSVHLSYRLRFGGVDILPNLGITSFDEARLFSGRKEGEHYMDFFSFGLAAHF